MNSKPWAVLAIGLALMATFVAALSAAAEPAAPGGQGAASPSDTHLQGWPAVQPSSSKPLDRPDPDARARIRQRERLLRAGATAEADALAQMGSEQVLVVLVEFAGTDVFTWAAPTNPADRATGSTWDPIGRSDPNEYTGTPGDCSRIITQTRTFTYSGPRHNGIERPRSAGDPSGQSIWTDDFSPTWFKNFMFGNGVAIDYARQDGSPVYMSFVGKSVKDFFGDLSGDAYQLNGDVIGWVQVPHSTWYYGADECPGGRSGGSTTTRGVIPGAGTSDGLVIDALKAVKAKFPDFDWHKYDTDADGSIDQLWIVHAGYGEEEDSATLLNRMPTNGTFYGEAASWSESATLVPAYEVLPGVVARRYSLLPENAGMAAVVHGQGHLLGAGNLSSVTPGNTSAGFWTPMADYWTGYPLGFQPAALDPLHLDEWGWLKPLVVSDPTAIYEVTLGQVSRFAANTAPEPAYRGVKIELEDQVVSLPVQPWQGIRYWWGGKIDGARSMMTTRTPIPIPAGGSPQLSFEAAYNLEANYDFLWVQASTDGATWNTLTNTHTTCLHGPGWIGSQYGFPDDLCGAGLGGFTGYNLHWPLPDVETFDLSAYAGKSIRLRFWYMTDSTVLKPGPFLDNVKVVAGARTLFSDDAEAGDARWTYEPPWMNSDGTYSVPHSYYLQWRNVSALGGYDSALGDPRFRFGPANTGLLVWYNNTVYDDNEVRDYLAEPPSFGAKGRMLVVDSHPDPIRDPHWVSLGYANESANLPSRSLMRDAPFALHPTVGFTLLKGNGAYADTYFEGLPAVSEFSDALGRYPGAELVAPGPVGQTAPRWMTRQWDASVVLPSRTKYGLQAPGYNGTDRFLYDCSRNATGQVVCTPYSTGIGQAGGNGNPGDVLGQYGWHVAVISESADQSWARVRIWNSSWRAYLPTMSKPQD